jgi:hypothetical protein
MSHYRYFKIIFILIPVIFLGFLVYQDVVPGGRLLVDYDFCHESPFISNFSPAGRVLPIEKIKTNNSKYCQQKMIIDPVYFDIRLPQGFDEVRLIIWYKKLAETKLQIGPAVDLSAWQWQLADVSYTRSDSDWQVGAASYDIFSSKLDNSRLRFLISSPGLSDSKQEITFQKIEIEFIKDPISNWTDVVERLKGFVAFSRLKFLIPNKMSNA